MSEYYRVTLDGQPVRHVEASSKPEARRLALADMKIERMAGSEVAAMIEAGFSVTRASAGAEPVAEGE